MIRDRWTLLLFRGVERPVRQFSVSHLAARRVTLGAALFAVTILTLTAAALSEGSARVRANLLDRENQMLAAELDRIQSRVTSLESTLVTLTDRDGEVRALAGLDRLDDDVLRVGVGGPGLRTPESNPLFDLDEDLANAAFAASYDLSALERRVRLLSESMDEASDSLTAHRDLLESTPSILPTAGLLSSRFSLSRFHPIHNRPLPHEGIDVAAPRGTPILAAAKGTVLTAGWYAGLGQMVEIDHGYGSTTRYGHASNVLVRVGQRVGRGDIIAEVGRTGIATSSHLHYEVRVAGKAQNPMNYVLPGIIP
jgi:hypothetical protein